MGNREQNLAAGVCGVVAVPPVRPAARRQARHRRSRGFRGSTRGVVALEFAILATPFFALMLFIFELGYDLYSQEELDTALHAAVRQIQTGNAQNLTSSGSNDFVNGYLCPQAAGLLYGCNSRVYVKIQKLAFSTSQDFYDFTTGQVPVTGGSLDLVGGGYLNSTGTSTFCNSGPGQFILVSALYLGPSFVGTLLPNSFSVINPFGGRTHVTLSTTGVVTESYSPTAAAQGSSPAAPC